MPTRRLPRVDNAILASLSAEEYALIAPELTEQSFPLGTQIQEMDAEVLRVHFPYSGMITLLDDGSTIEAATVGKEGATHPLAAIIEYRAESRSLVQIEGGCAHIAASTLRSLGPRLPGLRLALQRFHGHLLTQAMQSAACNAAHATQQRMARWLLTVHDRAEGNSFHLTQDFLAQMLGLWRPTVSTAAAELQRGGFITYRRGNIEILDRAGLEDLSCECYAVIRGRREAYLDRLRAD